MDSGPDGKAFKRLNAIHLLLSGVAYQLALRNSRAPPRSPRKSCRGLTSQRSPARPTGHSSNFAAGCATNNS